MVLRKPRKPPPPRLENLSKWPPRSKHHSSASPPSSSSPSQHHSNRFPSQESVYSPDLNTSPAFDLMSLEEVQRSPAGSPMSRPSNSWSDGLRESVIDNRPGTEESHRAATDHNVQWNPEAPVPGSHGMVGNDCQQSRVVQSHMTGEVPVQLQSNNPFLKGRSADSGQNSADRGEWIDRYSQATTTSGPLSQSKKGPLQMRYIALTSPSGRIHSNDGTVLVARLLRTASSMG